MKDLLILTLHSGENEFPLCKASLASQTFRGFDHIVFENLGNNEGHETLYRTIMEQAGNYARFLKLDADMVLRGGDSLASMLTEFDAERDADCVAWHVFDYYSNRNILGVHMFSNRVTWRTDLPELYVDPDPSFPGRRVILRKEWKQHVLHSPSPSPRQAFEFGIHRAQKCFNQLSGPDYARRREAQFETLHGVWRAFLQSGDRMRGLAMAGAEHCRRGSLRAGEYKNLRDCDAAFARTQAMSTDDMKSFCRPYWSFAGRLKHVLISASLKMQALAKARSGTAPALSPQPVPPPGNASPFAVAPTQLHR